MEGWIESQRGKVRIDRVPTILILQGPDKGQRYDPAEGEMVLLGRASEALPLTDFTVSRRHAELRPTGRGWTLDDLKSANGTYLNGRRLERPMRLKHGDQIRMGATLMVWDAAEELGAEEGAATPASSLVDLDSAERTPASMAFFAW